MGDHRLRLSPGQRISRDVLRGFGRWLVWRGCTVEVSGKEHVPRRGPALLAARHVHHLYDAAILGTVLPRPVHFLVALDWTHTRRQRWLLETACKMAAWPGLLRPDRIAPSSPVWSPDEVARYVRRSLEESAAVLAGGRVLVVFPEGSPVVDPEREDRPSDSLLPYQPGFLTIARRAARLLGRPVPVVPVGLAYKLEGGRWRVRVALGEPIAVAAASDRAAVCRTVEAAVRRLSGL